TVTFDDDNGTTKQVIVETGSKVTKPADPTRTGYSFVGWLSGDDAWDFNTSVTSDMTIKAQWVADAVIPQTGENAGYMGIQALIILLLAGAVVLVNRCKNSGVIER
ncbi:MAG: InlB B-repeat-containing protein, partial [Lachnospiraceae bacterium]|nr:InlB B-repeat-containing protein [Lachnospiraceae bacterium]